MKFKLLAACGLLFASPLAAETLNNSTVTELVKVGLSNDAIIAKIKSTPGQYDLNANDLIALKNAGVPGDVIAAMISGYAEPKLAPTVMSLTDINPAAPHTNT